MSQFIDLSHTFEDGMPGMRITLGDGTVADGPVRVRPWLTRDQLDEALKGESSFEITEVSFPTAIGTYIDSPFSRFAGHRDISELRIEELVLPGIVIDARGVGPGASIGPEVLPPGPALSGKAVLVNFGWDKYWGQEAYDDPPFVSGPLVERLVEGGVRLLGVDTGNADSPRAMAHPVHTRLLSCDIIVSENLTNLDRLHGHEFRFFAVPLKGRKCASMSVRAFAEISLRPSAG